MLFFSKRRGCQLEHLSCEMMLLLDCLINCWLNDVEISLQSLTSTEHLQWQHQHQFFFGGGGKDGGKRKFLGVDKKLKMHAKGTKFAIFMLKSSNLV